MPILRKTKLVGLAFASSAFALFGVNAAADFVILDDLIVDGSACVGFDCVDGESFGFDTIRLKENNTRLKFQDTSVAAAFPDTSWQLTANDSANGGAHKFSIEDVSGGRIPFTVEANARTNSLFIDDGGRIGLGTNTPSQRLHLLDGDTPGVRLAQDGSNGFAPQTWDMAGNETNFFVRDATNGSTLPFRIRPGADSNALFIDDNNDVGLGTASPDAALHLERSDDSAKILVEDTDAANGAQVLLELRNVGNPQILLNNTNNSNEWNIGGGANLVVSHNGGANVFTLSNSGDLTLTGQIITAAGNTCDVGCDAVFSPDYDLPTIEEHAEQMYANSYLPVVGPTPDDAEYINVTQKIGGMLNELEKAHIYIAELNEQNKALQDRIERLEAQSRND